jgi:hypothetical protein
MSTLKPFLISHHCEAERSDDEATQRLLLLASRRSTAKSLDCRAALAMTGRFNPRPWAQSPGPADRNHADRCSA